MVMRREKVKEASLEVVDALKCVLQAQTGKADKASCVPVMMKPVHRFCEAAKEMQRKMTEEERKRGLSSGGAIEVAPRETLYELSRYLGFDATARKKMGTVCSHEESFPECDKAIALAGPKHSWDEYVEHIPPCKVEVVQAINDKPIEKSQDYSRVLESFETLRNWQHLSGYNLPDNVWLVPYGMREQVRELFEYLASEKVTSVKDLEAKAKEIRNWE